MNKEQGNIDSLFKSKLENRSVEPSTAFLYDLNQKLDRNEKRGKRRLFVFLFFSLFGGMTLIAMLFVSRIGYDKVGVVKGTLNRTLHSRTEVPKIDMKNNQNTYSTDSLVTYNSKLTNNIVLSLQKGKLYTPYVAEETNENQVRKEDQIKSYGMERINSTRADTTDSGDVFKNAQMNNGGDNINADTNSNDGIVGTNITANNDVTTLFMERIDSTLVVDIISDNDSLYNRSDDDTVYVDFSLIYPSKATFSILAGIGLSGSLSKIIGPDGDYLTKRSAEEAGFVSSIGELLVEVEKGNFLLSSGLGLYTVGEKVNYTPIEKDSSILSGYELLVDMNGDTMEVPIYERLHYTDSSSLNANGKNGYSYFYVPVRVGYNLGLGSSKWSINPDLGIGVGFSFPKQGNYINPQGDGISRVLNTRLLVNYDASIQFRRSFSKGFFYVSPSYRNSFNAPVRDENTKTLYNTLGVLFGVGITIK